MSECSFVVRQVPSTNREVCTHLDLFKKGLAEEMIDLYIFKKCARARKVAYMYDKKL